MTNKYMVTNGGALKAVDGIRDSWDFVEAMAQTGDAELYARVAAVYRAANLTADAISNMPFAVVRGEEDYDTSADWQNKIGTLPDPRALLRLLRMSLFFTNTAYARLAKTNSVKKRWFYVIPNSITIETDLLTGEVKELRRWLGGSWQSFQPDDKNWLVMWKLDYTTELLPSPHTEFKALAASAGILHAADYWTKNYFSNGAVKPTIVSVKGVVTDSKKDELQTAWAKFMRGLGKTWGELAKVLNADAMDVKQLGDGLGDIKDSPVYKQAIENVAMASGMPLSLLLANSANYATAQAEYAAWFRDSVTPAAYLMQEALNEQIFKPAGLYFEFRPETAEPSQQEEVERAGAFSTYVSAGIKPSIAAQIVGIDLPSGVEYDDLDPEEKEEQPEAVPAAAPEAAQPVDAQPNAPSSDEMGADVEDDIEDDEEDAQPVKGLSFEAWKELDIWKRKATKAAKRGEALPVDFVCRHIPDNYANTIRTLLQRGDVSAAFAVKREFGSDEERRAAFARMAEDEGGIEGAEKLIESHTGYGGNFDDRREKADRIWNSKDTKEVYRKQQQVAIGKISISQNERDDLTKKIQTFEKMRQIYGLGKLDLNKSADLATLAASLDRAAAAAMQPAVKAEPTPQPVINVTMPSITLNAQMPAQDAPSVTVNIPEQPAPVVNVQPAQIEVKNQPANVVVNLPERKPIEAELTTDPRTGKKILKAK